MGSRYEKGRRDEWRARKDMVKMGYVVIRSAGSKGPFDLIGIGPTNILLVQVKSANDNPKKYYEQLQAVPSPPNTIKQIWQHIPYKGWQVTTIGVQLPDQGLEAQLYEFHPSPPHPESVEGSRE